MTTDDQVADLQRGLTETAATVAALRAEVRRMADQTQGFAEELSAAVRELAAARTEAVKLRDDHRDHLFRIKALTDRAEALAELRK